MIAPPRVSYPLDEESWGAKFDPARDDYTSPQINNEIALMIVRCDMKGYNNFDLWEEFQETFEGWTLELLSAAHRDALKDLRTYLLRHGVYVKPRTTSYAKVILDVLAESEQHVWTQDEIEANNGIGPIRRVIETTETPRPRLRTEEIQSPRRQDFTSETPTVRNTHTRQSRFGTRETDERQIPEPRRYERFTATPHPRTRDNTVEAPFVRQAQSLARPTYPLMYPTEQQWDQPIVRQPNTARLIADLMKIYNSEDKKYGGDQYDILDTKLQIFYDYCTKIGIDRSQFHTAFSVMLKKRAAEFYYDKIAGRSYDFQRMLEMTRAHFETEENRQKYLSEWRETTLTSVINKNPDKTRLECLETMFDALRTAQRGLSVQYQTEHTLRDQVLNACRGVPECNLALFKPAPTFEGLCADLRSAIGTATRTKEMSTFYQGSQDRPLYDYDQHFTDRTFGGQAKRYPPRPFTARPSKTPSHSFQIPNPQPWKSGNAGNGSTNLKCYICQKPGCWSTNHTNQERTNSFKKIKSQFTSSLEMSDDEIHSFLAEYEGSNTTETQQPEEDNWPYEQEESEQFLTEFGEVNGFKTMSILNDQSVRHEITRSDIFTNSYDVFTVNGRYSSDVFQGIMPDSGAAGISTAGEPQVEALQKQIPNLKIDRTTEGNNKIRFGKGSAISKGTVEIQTPIGQIKFHVVPTDTPFLLCIQDMDKLGVRLDNLRNILIQGDKNIPIVRKWGHPWMLLNQKEQTLSYSHLTEPELRQLHRRFGHPSSKRLFNLLQRAGHGENLRTIEQIVKVCQQCQLHGKQPGRFKFSLKDDYEFNFEISVDILHIDGMPTLQIVDEATSFIAARFLKGNTAKIVWDTLRTCWIDTYLGPPDYIVHDAGKNFASTEFRANARAIGSEVKEVPVEAHNSIGKVERYHIPLRRAYEILKDELKEEKLDKDTILQLATKAVNDTAGPDGLVPTLLVFGAYPRMSDKDMPSQSIVHRSNTIRTTMQELRKIKATRQIKDALAMRNGPSTLDTVRLTLQSDVRVWREKKGWTGPFRLLAIDGNQCTINMPYGPTNFRTTVVKPFFHEELEPVESTEIRTTPALENSLPKPKEPRSRTTPVVLLPHKSLRQLQAESFLTKKEEQDLDLSRTMRNTGVITTPGQPFEESQRKEIDTLIARGVFEFVRFDPSKHQGRIFNSRLVNEVKGKATDAPYEKSRLVIQAYNDRGKEEILTQSPTIQRVSQRLIISLAPSLVQRGISLFSRDITQAYVQSTTTLNRQILARIPREIRHEFPEGTIMIVRKPLYGVPEAGTHWWATYNRHHKEKIGMETSTYDPCLLISGPQKPFGIVGMQTDDTLILGSQEFKEQEDQELKKADFLAKPVDCLSYDTPLIFNGCILKQEDNSIMLVQKGQGSKIQPVEIKSTDRTIQYREQRARGAYIATICQPEAIFDLSVAAQHQDPSKEDAKALNKRLEWQMKNVERGIRYIPLDLNRTKLFVFVDGSFANNKDLSSQIGYVIIFANEEDSYEDNSFQIKGNLIHWSSTKSKRVTRSVLASEIYGMVSGVDMAIAMKTTLDKITTQLDLPPMPIIVCTDSYSLYECLVKLGTTKEKRLMIDIMALRQSYEHRELAEVRWINGQDNLADAMTKASPNTMLTKFLNTNESIVRIEGWVKREEK